MRALLLPPLRARSSSVTANCPLSHHCQTIAPDSCGTMIKLLSFMLLLMRTDARVASRAAQGIIRDPFGGGTTRKAVRGAAPLKASETYDVALGTWMIYTEEFDASSVESVPDKTKQQKPRAKASNPKVPQDWQEEYANFIEWLDPSDAYLMGFHSKETDSSIVKSVPVESKQPRAKPREKAATQKVRASPLLERVRADYAHFVEWLDPTNAYLIGMTLTHG